MAARFAVNTNEIGDDVRCLAGGLALLISHFADIAGALLIALNDFAKPAAAIDIGQCEGCDHRGRDALLRMDAGMRSFAGNFRLPALRPHCANADFRGRLAVEVEAHDGTMQILRINMLRSVEPALFAHSEQQCEWRR